MKILQFANKMPYPAKDGGSIATFSLARSFAALGHEVTILAMNTSKHYYKVNDIPEEIRKQVRIIGVDIDTTIRKSMALRNLLFSRMPYNAERFVSSAVDKKLASLLSEEKFDVVQLEGLYLAPYINTIRANSPALIAMRAHNIEHEIWERSIPGSSSFQKIYLKILAKRIKEMEIRYLNTYDVMIPITGRDGHKLEEMGCRLPMKAIPTGIDLDKVNYDDSKKEYPSVFHIGALDWLPNQEGLLWFLDNVWPAVSKEFPEVKFYVAGRNAPRFIRELNYPGLVFLGEVDDAYRFMNEKAVMVVPLQSGSGMRIKIIEGMALGKSIITTSIGTEGISTSHGENIMIADSPADFIKSLKLLLSDYQLFSKIGSNAFAFVTKNFDNLAIAKGLVKFYETHLR